MEHIRLELKITRETITQALTNVEKDSCEEHLLQNIEKELNKEDITGIFAINANGTLAGAIHFFDSSSDGIFIKDLVVMPLCQKNGIGTMIIKELVRTAQSLGKKAIALFAITESIPFYQAKGFRFPHEDMPEIGYLSIP